jgi:hypothetical protein
MSLFIRALVRGRGLTEGQLFQSLAEGFREEEIDEDNFE